MKALTLRQPWATLVAIGAKTIETRPWATSYRGPLAIHAAKGFPKEARDLLWKDFDFYAAFRPDHAAALKLAGVRLVPNAAACAVSGQLPLGSVVATCRLVSIIVTSRITALSDQERAFGDYSPGRYAWILEDVKPLAVPIPAKGALSLWEWFSVPTLSKGG
jgi:hypothetical protein